MNRQQKEAVVADVEKLFTESPATFLVNYKGLTVAQMQKLRRGLRAEEGSFKITKARLMKIAAQKASNKVQEFESFKEEFKEQVGLVFSQGDNTPGLAKVLTEFAKENDALEILSGLFEEKVITQDQIKQLASLPSREVLLGMLAGALQAPISGLARTLHQLPTNLAYALQQVAEKKQKEEQQ